MSDHLKRDHFFYLGQKDIIAGVGYSKINQDSNLSLHILSTLLSHNVYTIISSYVHRENIPLVRRAFEAFNTGDTSKVPEYISDDYINVESQKAKDSYRSKLRGPEEFVDTINNLRSAFPDLHYEEHEIISQGIYDAVRPAPEFEPYIKGWKGTGD
jgi:hypothetical protein